MRTGNPIYKISLALSLVALTGSIFAQTKPQEKKPTATKDTVVTEEIEVVRAYKPVLADAAKIRRSPDLNSRKPFKPVLTYNVFDEKFELNRDIKQLQAQELVSVAPSILKNNYVKVGAGNFGTGLGELYLNNGRDEALQAGLYLKHLNQSGDIEKQKFSNQQAGVFGRSILDKISLNGELSYNRLGTYFYGVPDTSFGDPAKQRLSTISLKGELLKNYSQNEEDDFDYAAKLNADFFGNYYEGRENSVAVSGFVNKAWNKFNFGLNTSLDITSVKDFALNTKNNIFRLNPYAKLQGENYQLTIGLNVVSEFGTNGRTNVLPAVTAEFPIMPGYATIFAGFTGDVQKTSLRDFSYSNPYLKDNITIKNAVEKTNIYGGIKGNAGSGFGFKAAVSYRTITDMPFYVHSPLDVRKFDIVYDDGNTKIIGLEGEISVNASEIFMWTGKLNINNYEPAKEKDAWYRPDFRLQSNARLFVNKKFTLDGEVLINGKTNARTYSLLSPISGAIPQEQIVPVKSFVDMNAGAEYRWKEKLGVYLRINNLFGNAYQQFLYYPKLGLNVAGGLNYSF